MAGTDGRTMKRGRRSGAVAVAALVATVAAVLTLAPAAATGQVPPTGVSPSPAHVDFGEIKIGSPSPVAVITVRGGYCIDFPVHQCQVEPMDVAVSGPYTIANYCPPRLFGALGPGICSVAVFFTPQSRGPQPGFLRLQSSPTFRGVPLSGTGCRKQKTKRKREKKKKKLVCTAKKP